MNGEEHVIATCNKCHTRFDPLNNIRCPVCRMESVKRAFRPVDELRTALGEQGVHWHGDEGYYHNPVQAEDETEVPRGCKLPLYEDDQVYQLRRLFRL